MGIESEWKRLFCLSLRNKMGNYLLAVREIDYKYIAAEREEKKIWQLKV